MMRTFSIGACLAALAVAGCASAPQTRVTRFHFNQPIARGQIAVEPLLPADRGGPEFQTYASIVGAELARNGFSEAPGLRASEQVAVIAVEQTVTPGQRRSPISIGLGGGVGGGGWRSGGGVGGGVSFPVGRARPNDIALTRLVVQIKRRSEGTVVWEGRAETSARVGSPEGQPATVVQRLATALFKDFPGISNRTITVK